MNALQATSVGYRVKDLLEDRAAGQVYSVHANAAYCSIPMRPLLLIHCSELGGIPFGVGAAMETGYLKEIGLDRGMQIDISDSMLLVPAVNFGVDLCDATVWHPAGNSPDNFSRSRVEDNLGHALHEIARRGSKHGLGGLAFVFNDLFRDKVERCEGLNLLCRVSAEPLRQLVAGIQQQDLPLVENSLSSLIGLGIGLTPSMDDVITGLITTLHRLGDRLSGGFPWVSTVGERIRVLSSSRTTLVSRNHLLFATCGDRFEILDNLIVSLLSSSREDLNDKIGKLVSCGATSGTELTIGILLGVRVVLGSPGDEGSREFTDHDISTTH
jgi:hypothetical protein